MSASAAGAGEAAERPPARPLTSPADGVPPVVDDPRALDGAVARLAAGEGPVAVDAERASGFRYGQRAYLVQLRRRGAGTVLVDPAALDDLDGLAAALSGPEWVLHAASQDLPCLAERGMSPASLFDTELAGRLLNLPRVGLAPLAAEVLGWELEKGHGAADWSARPLAPELLRYAALDVELLLELRDALAVRLEEAGKLDWARQEFAALAGSRPAPPRADPWRRTAGMHRVRTRRQLAVVRALWQARDGQARRRDLSPGRVLPDAAVVAAALAAPADAAALVEVPGFGGRGQRRHAALWWQAVAAALALPDSALPPHSLPGQGPPPPRAWRDRDPAAAARLVACRAAVALVAAGHDLPVENLLAPDLVRRLAWSPPAPDRDAAAVAAVLAAGGARAWQVELCAGPLADALA